MIRRHDIAWQHPNQTFSPEGASSAVADVPTRDQIATEDKWRLEDLYTTLDGWEQDVAQLRAMTEQFVGYQGRLGESAEQLLAAIRLMDQINETFGRVGVYAMMKLDEDNADPASQALEQRERALVTEIFSQMAFFEPELLAIPTATVDQYLAQEPGLLHYQFYLTEVLRQKPHVLSIAEEQLLAQASEVLGAPRQIFGMLNDADIRFPSVTNDDGVEIEITHGRYQMLRESRNRDVRKAAFEAFMSSYDAHKNMLAATYAASVKRDVFLANVRHYDNTRAMFMYSDNVPETVYDSLITAVHESLPALGRYTALRKRLLGVEELHLYDLYVPIVPELEVSIPYADAVDSVLKSLAPLGSSYIQTATDGLGSGWVDVYETRGKTSGAYSAGAYGVHPYILLNHQETFDNMFTLAHELGHAMHTYYSSANQPHVYADYTIFVAEVASTLNENLLMHYLKSTTTDKAMKAYIVNHHLETIRGTLIRQTLFAEFEKLTHARVEAGEPLTLEWMCDSYRGLYETYYGENCVIDPQIDLEWAYIPHFYRPFYVYKYATGISAATALSERILQEGTPAAERYLQFLQGGSSDYPIQLLRGAGVDMESPEPVKSTLALFARLVDELESLLA